MPMVSSFVAGGVTNDTSGTADFQARCDKFETLLKEVGNFIFKEYVPLVLTLGRLYPEYDNVNNSGLAGLAAGACKGYGAGVGNFLSWGAFPSAATGVGATLAIKGAYKLGSSPIVTFNSGKADSGTATTFVQTSLVEHIAHSRYAAYAETGGYNSDTAAAYPGNVSRTKPKRNATVAENKYSWLKAPRLVISGTTYAMEVGPFARLVTNNLYPVDGTGIAAKLDLTGLGMADYMDYVKTAAGNTGLDPAMVDPDIAVALVRASLAEVWIGTTHADAAWLAGKTHQDIVDAYTNTDAVIMGTVTDWIYGLKGGLSTMDRLRGRALEALFIVQLMIGGYSKTTGWPSHGGWIGQLRGATGATYNPKAVPTTPASGFGVSEAPRGGLAHFISIDKGKITKYQCVVPTTWNASPKDSSGNRGAMEQAMIDLPFDDAGAVLKKQDGTTQNVAGGVEALRVAQSFDPCIACAIH
jgi:Ni,Fe-hydrogenase I large subunit